MAVRIGLLRSSALQNGGLDVSLILQCRTSQETNPKRHWGSNYFLLLFDQILVLVVVVVTSWLLTNCRECNLYLSAGKYTNLILQNAIQIYASIKSHFNLQTAIPPQKEYTVKYALQLQFAISNVFEKCTCWSCVSPDLISHLILACS